MMMVVTVMAVDLHLRSNYRLGVGVVKEIFRRDSSRSVGECATLHFRKPGTNAQLQLANGASLVENGAVREDVKIFTLATALLSCTAWGYAVPVEQSAVQAQVIPVPEARIDINHASVDELMKAPGMTHTWAERIIRFRPYRTKQDLVDHGVITGEIYDRIKDYIIAHREKQ
jgi:competence protein ComEA